MLKGGELMKTLVPAYGRDYKTAGAVKKDWDAKKDFIIADLFDMYDNKPVNITDTYHTDWDSVLIRYDKLTKVTVIKLRGVDHGRS
jgi:hypothetical protein